MTTVNPPHQGRSVAALALLYAVRMLGLFMVLPILALYADDYRGATPLLLGLALGIYGFSQALLQIPFGRWSDRWGRKPVIALGLLVFLIGSVVAATTDSIWGLILGRALQGAGAVASAIMALVADTTSERNRTKAMAAIGASIGLSFSVAMVLGPWVSQWFGLAGVFWLTAALALVGLAIVYWVVPTPVRHSGTAPPLRELRGVLGQVELLRLDVGIFVLHALLMAAFVAVPLVLSEQLAIAPERHWQVYLGIMALAFVAMLPLVLAAERGGYLKPVFLGAIALLAVSLLLMTGVIGTDRLWLLWLGLFFLGFNLLEATLPSLVSKTAPAAAKGAALGVYSTSQFFGAFVGGTFGGALYQWGGAAWVFQGGAALALIWLVMAWPMRLPAARAA